MTVKRTLKPVFTSTHQAINPNLLVSGCSYTWNNSNEHIVSWPNYLRDLANYTVVHDCSQSAGGNNHIFNSIVYTLENQPELTADNTDIIIMWSGMERTDILASNQLVEQWYHMEHMTFSQGRFASLNVWPDVNWCKSNTEAINHFLKMYRVLIDNRAQILESCTRICGLMGYLQSRGFNPIFIPYRPMSASLALIGDEPITQRVLELMAPIEDLDTYTSRVGSRIPNDGHPTPDSHLNWTREILIPFLTGQFIQVK